MAINPSVRNEIFPNMIGIKRRDEKERMRERRRNKIFGCNQSAICE
jgi:hypothetical protein